MAAMNAGNAKLLSRPRAVLIALVLVGASCSFLAPPAKADNDDRRHEVRERHVVHERHHRDWRDRDEGYGYYAPPPVIYAPPPRSPSIDFIFPIRIR